MAHSIGIIGLGRMGMQIARRLHKKGLNVSAWNRSERPRIKLAKFFGTPPSPPSSPPNRYYLTSLPRPGEDAVGRRGRNVSPSSVLRTPSPLKGEGRNEETFAGERNKRRGGKSAVFESIPQLISAISRPRVIWLMLPAHDTDKFIQELSLSLSKGDIVIDGSNSFYRDSIKRANKLARYKIHYLDAGTSGGVWGERNGFSIMVGGSPKIFKKVEPIFRALAARSSTPSPDEGRVREGLSYGLVGKTGAGHFVKMVHNGIEYGMMEAIAEGFAVLDRSSFKLDLAKVAQIWHKGAVVSSWLIDLARDIFEKEDLDKIVGYIPHTGEGEWTIKEAKKLGVDVRIIANAFRVRLESSGKRNQNKFSNKIVALLRNRFGGHEVIRK